MRLFNSPKSKVPPDVKNCSPESFTPPSTKSDIPKSDSSSFQRKVDKMSKAASKTAREIYNTSEALRKYNEAFTEYTHNIKNLRIKIENLEREIDSAQQAKDRTSHLNLEGCSTQAEYRNKKQKLIDKNTPIIIILQNQLNQNQEKLNKLVAQH